MKKLVALTICVFAFTSTISLTILPEKNIGLESAFANGSCLEEQKSICGLNGKNYRNRYLSSGGGDGFFSSEFE